MIFPKALDLDRPKRPRTTFSESQLSTLESEFQRNPYLIGKERTRLAANLGLSETQVCCMRQVFIYDKNIEAFNEYRTLIAIDVDAAT